MPSLVASYDIWPGNGEERKGKESKSIYIAPFHTKVHTKRSGMDYTVLPTNNTMPAWSYFGTSEICHLLTYLDTYPLTSSPGTHKGHTA